MSPPPDDAGSVRGLSETPAPSTSRRVRTRAQRLRGPLLLLGPLVVLLGGGYVYLTGGRYASTDDAYVRAAQVPISADVGARVVSLEVADNQLVQTGQVLFRLDDREFKIAVEQAEAALAAAKLQVAAAQATVRQREADVHAASDTLAFQQRELERQQTLRGSGVSSQAQLDQATHAVDAARQAAAAMQQQLAVAVASLGGDPDQPVEQQPAVRQAEAALDRAQLDLSFTVVKAPEPGLVTKVDQLQVGTFLNRATVAFYLVSNTKLWVEANFKETELAHMRPGQPATIDIDAYPDVQFCGRVDSLSPGTGSTFSMLPAENATGNWVKVTQRLPVRLALCSTNPDRPLHAGLSVSVDVDTGYQKPIARSLFGDLAVAQK